MSTVEQETSVDESVTAVRVLLDSAAQELFEIMQHTDAMTGLVAGSLREGVMQCLNDAANLEAAWGGAQ